MSGLHVWEYGDAVTPERMNELRAAAAKVGVDTIIEATLSDGETYDLDPSEGDQFILILTGDANLAVPSFVHGSRFLVQVEQDSTGGHVLSLPTAVGSVNLDTTASTFELLVYRGIERNGTPTLYVTHATGSGGAEPAWTPSSMSDQIAWYDPNALTDADATDVTVLPNQWDEVDLVGNSAEGTYPTVQTVNGRRVVRFDGDLLDTGTAVDTPANWAGGAYTQPATVALVVKVAAPSTSTQSVVGGRDTTDDMQVFVEGSGTTPGSTWAAHAGSRLSSTEADDNTWTTVVAVYNGSSGSIRVDGVETTGNTGSESTDSLRLGANGTASNHAACDVADVIVVGHAVAGDELTNLENYLNGIRDELAGA